ncbi:sensor histidine kinase [Anaeromicrobium sediminis]|uniref:histidine kinase n=1 Tax=Anaeromicrobium sediminis TaxID=1478221 RepID=A0A267MKW0_9FIRM|nr:HAMP domain-containing sensor histidine kinase [Anaeromicrobium sediminis]PAB60052.1 two-component sensor histidine kinase [Anaeromicrobium sediminis]
MKISIKLKSSIFLALLLFITVSLLSYLVLKGIERDQQKQYEEHLAQQTKIANIYVRQIYLMGSIKEPRAFLKEKGNQIASQLDLMSGMQVSIYDMSGREVGNSINIGTRTDVKDILVHGLNDKIAYQIVNDKLDYVAPIHDINGQIGVIKFEYSLRKNIEFYNNIKSLFFNIGTIVFALTFLGGYFYFNDLTKGILKLNKDASNIEKGFYDEILPLRRNDELGELSQGIYYMSNQIKNHIEGMEKEQEKLRLAVKKLKELEKQQKTFIGNITHEFKTPLTVINAYIDLLEMYSDDSNLLEDAKSNISKEAQRLYEMVEKILYLSSLEKYDFELQSEKINIKEILEEICNRMKGKAQKFNIDLLTNLQSAYILGDKESLMHIFINLIDNGIKYNESNGKVFVNSYKKDGNVFIEVIDTGMGIPVHAREKIFEPFYTVSRDRSKEYAGTGLGLSLVKELVEKQKGNISILDIKRKGTTISIVFPLFS